MDKWFSCTYNFFWPESFGEAVGYAQTSISAGRTSAPLLCGIVYTRSGYSIVSTMSRGAVGFSTPFALIMVEPKAETVWEQPNLASLV